jgi:gamma-glutamyltranspeptidase/glutathione hydrolase
MYAMFSNLQLPDCLTFKRSLSRFQISVYLGLLTASNLLSSPIIEGQRAYPVEASKGMVVTSHNLATKIGQQVLAEGGNAIDAAVTAGFALAVTQPRSGNIGGGGFMLISNENSGLIEAIDYREKAPSNASRDMFLGDDREVDHELSRFSHLSAGVPGTPAGLLLALERHGTISRQRALAPAIRLAEEGFKLPTRFVKGTIVARDHLSKWPASRKIFYQADGTPYKKGDLFVQKDLAATLKRISDRGMEGFYEGKTARLIVEEMRENNGLISFQDLRNYRAIVRKPIHGTYRGYDIYSMTTPSSGGTHIIQILNILEGYPIGSFGHNSARTIHLMVEAMRRAYADRASYMGDQDFVRVPLDGLVSKEYANMRRPGISLEFATPSIGISKGAPPGYESGETTHFSIADQWGNAVSNTYTINFSYGSGIVVSGAGFLLNNEMDDFSAKVGTTNAFGLVGGEANKIEPNKRMLSSMSPTIVMKGGKNFLVTGSPGGSRIISTTLQVIMNVIDHGLNPQSAVNAPRIHHQWFPDEIRIEEGISQDTIEVLQRMGHKVVKKTAMGAIQTIMMDSESGRFYGAPDPRRSTSSGKGL